MERKELNQTQTLKIVFMILGLLILIAVGEAVQETAEEVYPDDPLWTALALVVGLGLVAARQILLDTEESSGIAVPPDIQKLLKEEIKAQAKELLEEYSNTNSKPPLHAGTTSEPSGPKTEIEE